MLTVLKAILRSLLVPHAEQSLFQSAAITFPFSETPENDAFTLSSEVILLLLFSPS